MAHKKIFNKELSVKSKNIKGQVRSEVAIAAMNAPASIQPNKKNKLKSSTRQVKHKKRMF